MKSEVVADTDVVSFQFKNDSRSELYRPLLRDHRIILSFMTVAELDQWAIRAHWGKPGRALMEHYVQQFTFAYCDRDLCRLWAEVSEGARSAGIPISTADAWIAATALAYNIPLVTHNANDYRGVAGLQIITAPV